MASIRPYNNKFRVQVEVDGRRKSKVFDSRRAAERWANQIEYEIRNREIIVARNLFGEALDRYAREVSPKKRGGRWEVIRLEKIQRDPIARIEMGKLQPADIAAWRDARLLEVQGASVRRELQLMGSVLNVAMREWGWIASNPVSKIQKPAPSPRRSRLPSPSEMAALQVSAGRDVSNKTARAFLAFEFSIETGMRAGEIVSLIWDRIDLDRRTAALPMTKNGEAREVALSSRAIQILEELRSAHLGDQVFALRSASLDVLWRKVRDRANVEGLNFHDARHAAITQLSKKLDVLELARMVGHKDIKMLLTYYEADAAAMAKKLD